MGRLKGERLKFYLEGLNQLPREFIQKYSKMRGKNGETLLYDEAEVWKRVINYRVAKAIKPKLILETHPGLGLSTELYRLAAPHAEIISLTRYEKQIDMVPDEGCDLIDIDPFGQPYHAIELALPKLRKNGVLMVSNGEMLAVTRKLKKSQFLKTEYCGKNAWRWVVEQYLPFLEDFTGLKVRFFYAFPTTVRVILSNRNLDEGIFRGCKKWMWWLSKYAET